MAIELIRLSGVHLTFGTTALLSGADLSVRAGDRIGLVGRNGSGKSTLLRIAAGLVVPDQGERFVHPGARVAYLPQEADLSGFASVAARRAGLNSPTTPSPATMTPGCSDMSPGVCSFSTTTAVFSRPA